VILSPQPFEIDLIPQPVDSFVAVRLRGIIVHRSGPSSASLVVLGHAFDLFLQSRREGRKLCLGDVILGILFPYRAADVAHGDASIVVNDRTPWAEFGYYDEVRDTRQRGGFVFGGERDIAIPSFAVETSRGTGDKIEYEVETRIRAMEDRV